MKTQEVFWFLLSSFLLFSIVTATRNVLTKSQTNDEIQTIYVKAVRCNFSEDYFYQNYSCYAKSYNRSFSTVNILSTVKPVNIDKVYLNWKLFFKYGVIYREVMYLSRIDYCQACKFGTSNKILKQIFSMMRDSDPKIFTVRCPGSLNITNFYIKTGTMLSIFPTGDYKTFFEWELENKTLVESLEIISSLNSPNKDTFG
ncbi:CLUMA_CG018031, isoform A [Clunio marinus]|uniref:CLUMA_CG018031, isoform A n=1 Tax=Clunio marinus TaxID=568069 RepID=A0A1J1J2P2_9DIPT|nr:CLUMA_CG018031, isoform A [Clunio marinus]